MSVDAPVKKRSSHERIRSLSRPPARPLSVSLCASLSILCARSVCRGKVFGEMLKRVTQNGSSRVENSATASRFHALRWFWTQTSYGLNQERGERAMKRMSPMMMNVTTATLMRSTFVVAALRDILKEQKRRKETSSFKF